MNDHRPISPFFVLPDMKTLSTLLVSDSTFWFPIIVLLRSKEEQLLITKARLAVQKLICLTNAQLM